jgi:AcrR family transcriptional regulator
VTAAGDPHGGTRTRPVLPEVIVREAIRLFGEQSYPVVGMRDLSKAVGVQPGSLYAHISSKEALLMLIVEQGITNYLDAVSAAVATDEPADVRLRAAIRAHMRVLATSIEQTKVTFAQWHYLGPENKARVVQLRQQYEDLFLTVAQDGIAAGVLRPVPHLRATLLGIIGGLSFAAEWYSPTKSDSPEGIADAIADALLLGLTPRP